MHITAIAVDDNPSALEILKKHTAKTPSLNLAQCFTQPLEALDCLSRAPVDLVFIDVEMDDLNGIDFIRIIKSKELKPAPKFVIVSAHDQYAIEGYNLSITDYLLKPVPYDRFIQMLEKVSKEKRTTQTIIIPQKDYLFVRNNGKTIRLRHRDVLYVQSDGHFVNIHLRERRHPLMLSYKMTQMEEMLPDHSFVRTHKRYIVNLEHIAEIDATSVCLDHVGLTIPVGGTYRHRINQLCSSLSA